MFTELAAPDSSSADRHGDLLPGTFSDLMVCSWESTPILFHIWGQPQNLPWESEPESSHLPARKGSVRAKVLALLSWAELSLALPEVDSIRRKRARQLKCNLRKCQSDSNLWWVVPLAFLPVRDVSVRTEMTDHCGVGMVILASG